MKTLTIDLIKKAIEQNGVVTRGSILSIAANRIDCSVKFLDLTFIAKGNPRVMPVVTKTGKFYNFS